MRLMLLLAAGAAAAVAAPVPKELQKPAVPYPLKVGDRREYAHPLDPDTVTQVREITAAEEKDGERYYTQNIVNGAQTNVMKVDKAGAVWMVAQNDETYESPYKVVGPGLKEGDSWECADGTGAKRTVGKAEKVTVPAGTYTAIPITVSYPNQPGGSVVVWYAEGVGLVRLDSGGRTSLVLKKYTPGKDK